MRAAILISLLASSIAHAEYTLAPAKADQQNDSYEPHLRKLDQFLAQELGPVLADWNAQNVPARIILEPRVQRLKLVRGFARVTVGPFVGGSYLSMRVDVRDQVTGELLDSREFMVKSNGFKGTLSFGERDRNIIPTAAKQVRDFLLKTGPTLAADTRTSSSAGL